MSAGLDRRHIRHAFGRAAASYEEHAVLQALVGARLRERLDDYPDLQVERVLDVGAGPGQGTAELARRFDGARIVALDLALPMLRAHAPHARIDRVGGDAQAIPCADASVDLVHSSLCLQWCEDPGLALAEFQRVLRPGGLLLFTTFGPGTLHELRGAFAEIDGAPHVSRFVDMHDIGDALLAGGFGDPVLERDDIVMTYPDVRALTRDLHAIGATNADAARRRGLTGRHRWARLADAYERHRRDGVLPATYEVIQAVARAPAVGQPRRGDDAGDLASFPIERLRGSRRRR